MKCVWPGMLWLLAVVPALVGAYVLLLRRRKKSAVRYASLALVKDALGPGQRLRRPVPPLLFLLALAATIVAVARPSAVITLPTEQRTIILTIDVSLSMRAMDIQPSRLQAAQAAAKALVEVAASDEQHLVAWLSKRLDTPVRAPSLVAAGYRLLGGRLLRPAGEAGAAPVALFMYENAQGKRLSLLVRREATATDTAFRFAQQGATNVFYWFDGPLGYALAGDVGRDELSAVAQGVYRQLNP